MTAEPVERLLLTPAECAEALAVSSDTVHRMIRRGDLPHVDVGVGAGQRHHVRIPAAALAEWVETRTSQEPS